MYSTAPIRRPSLFKSSGLRQIYSRIMNPTVAVMEERIAALEGGTAGLAASSGHAAQHLIFHTIMEPGAEFISARQLYGGSVNQFNQAFKKYDWHVRWADSTDVDSFKRQVTDKTRAIFCESIANPGGVISDLEGIARVAADVGVPFIVDNTLATPYLIRPFEWGAHIVVHSATKFLGGHGNSLAGAIVEAGTFDWAKSGNYKTLTEENRPITACASTRRSATSRFVWRRARCRCAISDRVWRRRMRSWFLPGWRRCFAHAASLRQCARGCAVAGVGSARAVGELCGVGKNIPRTRRSRNIVRRVRARFSRSD
jgi:O-acetylhomoserine/O-acetylserine sulfhydrylase-like pyridoxal-dependent enzyme